MKSNREPDPENATANLLINGIALYCFTAENKLQAAFIREPNHTLSLEISEVSAQGTRTSRPHALNLGAGQEIILEATNPVQATSSWFESPAFDRRHILQDFRFLPDLEGELHQRALDLKNPKDFDITLLTVNNAHFYARTLFGPVKKVEKPSGTSAEFGLITDVVAADILCGDGQAGNVSLENSGGQNRIELAKSDNVRYEISFQNICQVDITSTGTDFALCYALLSDPRNITFDLEPPVVLFSGDDACNGGMLSITRDLRSLLTSPTIPSHA